MASTSTVRVAPLYFVTALLGGALLLCLEPLFVKLALPFFGGAPAVWNVAFAFFTTALLVGYAYAHVLARAPLRTQLAVHAGLLLVAALVLPVRAAPLAAALRTVPPPAALLALLFERIGLPFVALAATTPLLQSWFSRRAGVRDPYRLYAASNAGSFIALVAYPFAIEPFSGLARQSHYWSFGYAAFAMLMVACGALAIPGTPQAAAPPRADVRPLPGGARIRAGWATLAAAPAILTLGLTSHLAAEVASLPFVWTAPLAAYLLAYALAFSRAAWRPALKAIPYAVVPLVVLLAVHERLTPLAYLALSLLALFLLTLGTAGRLDATRPEPDRLTEFYLWIGVGGAIGSLFAALVAPAIFPSIAEYPLGIVLCCLLLAPDAGAAPASALRIALGAAAAVGLVAATGLLAHFAPVDAEGPQTTLLLWVALAGGVCLVTFSRRVAFALALGALLLYGAFLHDPGGPVIARERNFFGTKQVTADPDNQFHFLISGGTIHGIQAVDPAKSDEPRGYYARSGPLGDVFAGGAQRFAARRIAIVGLGIGATACYRTSGQAWTFYEIDPAVVQLARDARYFSALESCAPDATVVLGDARLALEQAPPQDYALIVLDAYDSDQVPVHLLTREAMAAYLRQLAPDGVLAFHTSNRHFGFAPVLAGLAADAGLEALERDDSTLSPEELQEATMPSSWVVVTRAGRMLRALRSDARWHSLARDPSLPLWTDDYSSLARVLRPETL